MRNILLTFNGRKLRIRDSSTKKKKLARVKQNANPTRSNRKYITRIYITSRS